jgi:hypothetical protein
MTWGELMWSFVGVFLLVIVGLALLSHPAVGKAIHAFTALAVLLVIAFWVALVIWLMLPGSG